MLIKAPINNGTVVTFRVVTGETVMARYVEKTATHLVVTKPICANATQTEEGMGLYFTPFCLTVDEAETFRIPLTSILIDPMHPRKELESSYIKMTTGLEIPL